MRVLCHSKTKLEEGGQRENSFVSGAKIKKTAVRRRKKKLGQARRRKINEKLSIQLTNVTIYNYLQPLLLLPKYVFNLFTPHIGFPCTIP